MASDLVQRQSLVAPDLAELAARRLRLSGVAEAAFEGCLAPGDSTAAGSWAQAVAAMAGYRGRSGNTEAAVAGMTDRAHRLAGVAAGCRRSLRRSRQSDSQIGPEQAP